MNTDEGTQIKAKRRETIQRRVRRGRSAGCAEEGGRDPSPGVKQRRRTQDDDACRVATNRVGHGKLQTESSRTTIHISKTTPTAIQKSLRGAGAANGNVKGAQLKLAVTNSKATATAKSRRDDCPQAGWRYWLARSWIALAVALAWRASWGDMPSMPRMKGFM